MGAFCFRRYFTPLLSFLILMPSFYAEIEIDAPRSRVWNVLLNKQEWKTWNSFLFDRTPERPFESGRSLLLAQRRKVREPETTFEAQIIRLQPDYSLYWRCEAPGYRSEHRFDLLDSGYGRTKYSHREKISGRLAWLFTPVIRHDEQLGMRRMAYELKQYAEWQRTKFNS
ncbi:MAG: SRPBCC domain-containing protein [Elainellaceae cyanobacterium]